MVDLILFTPDHILFHNSMQNGHNGNALWSHGLQNLWTKYFQIRNNVPLPWKTKVWKYVCLMDKRVERILSSDIVQGKGLKYTCVFCK